MKESDANDASVRTEKSDSGSEPVEEKMETREGGTAEENIVTIVALRPRGDTVSRT